MHRIFREILVLLGLLVLVSPVAAESELTGFQPRHLQALLGVMVADEDNYQGFDSSGEPLETDEVFGTFAMAGGMVQLADGPSIFEYGIETGAFFGWKDIDTDYAGSSNSSGNSNIILKVSSNFYMFEVLLGGFMGWNVSNHFRLYASAGPSLVWGKMSGDDGQGDGQAITDGDGNVIDWGSSETDIAMGLYGRFGIEYRFGKNLVVGASARYLATELDFSSRTGKVDLKGTEWFLTLGRRY